VIDIVHGGADAAAEPQQVLDGVEEVGFIEVAAVERILAALGFGIIEPGFGT
jgi:hypothetical protein